MIQLQKFNGKNTGNNEVIIDYKKRKVDFREIKGIGYNRVDNRVGGLIYSIYMRLALLIFLALTAKHLLTGEDVSAGIFALIFIYFGLYLISPIINFMFKKFDKNTEILPKVNAILIIVGNLFKLKKPFETLKIKPEDLTNNEFIINEFGNIFLNYKLKGDFAEFIERIEIKAIMPSNPYKFKARFIFSKKIKNGFMIVKYD